MALVRWNTGGRRVLSGQDRRDDIECLYEDLFGASANPWRQGRSRTEIVRGYDPRIDVVDSKEEVVVRAEVPGLDRDDLDVTIASELVTIKGERKDSLESESECFYCRETSFGSFERQVPLPERVVPDRAEATLRNGVLTLHLPKAEPKQAVKIKVN